MKRLIEIGVILIAAAACAAAQRLDGCETITGVGTVRGKSQETLDNNLRQAGYTFTKESLLSALRDPRPDVRGLAAGKLSETGDAPSLNALAEALSIEGETCAHFEIGFAIGMLGQDLFLTSGKQHPGGQPFVTPFQPCTPSDPPVLTLAIEQDPSSLTGANGPLIHVSARNVSGRLLPFVWASPPGYLFSVTLLEPGGGKAPIPKDREWVYHPLQPDRLVGGHGPIGKALKPGDEATWDWRPGNDFDMSTPGTYRLSLGGPIEYLSTSACSNTIDVIVGK